MYNMHNELIAIVKFGVQYLTHYWQLTYFVIEVVVHLFQFEIRLGYFKSYYISVENDGKFIQFRTIDMALLLHFLENPYIR